MWITKKKVLLSNKQCKIARNKFAIHIIEQLKRIGADQIKMIIAKLAKDTEVRAIKRNNPKALV